MEQISAYNLAMKDSTLRTNAINFLLEKIKNGSVTHAWTAEELEKLRELLSYHEVEDGVSVFFPTGVPSKKRCIGRIELSKKYAYLYFGENLNKSLSSNPKPLALGILMLPKSSENEQPYTVEELGERFPDFFSFMGEELKENELYTIYSYSSAGAFSKAVKKAKNGWINGMWILQEPKGQSFIPYRSIGLVTDNNVIHLFQVKNNQEKEIQTFKAKIVK